MFSHNTEQNMQTTWSDNSFTFKERWVIPLLVPLCHMPCTSFIGFILRELFTFFFLVRAKHHNFLCRQIFWNTTLHGIIKFFFLNLFSEHFFSTISSVSPHSTSQFWNNTVRHNNACSFSLWTVTDSFSTLISSRLGGPSPRQRDLANVNCVSTGFKRHWIWNCSDWVRLKLVRRWPSCLYRGKKRFWSHMATYRHEW